MDYCKKVLISAVLIVIGISIMMPIIFSVQGTVFYFGANKEPSDIWPSVADAYDASTCEAIKRAIPQSVRDDINSSGWTLDTSGNLSASWITGAAYNTEVLAHADYVTKTIVLNPNVWQEDDDSQLTFASIYCHEYGHAVDETYGWISQSAEFRKVYTDIKSTGTEIFDQYFLDQAAELFAEGFALYTLCPEHLESKLPTMYAYYNTLFNHLEKPNYPTYVFRFCSMSLQRISIYTSIIAIMIAAPAIIVPFIKRKKV